MAPSRARRGGRSALASIGAVTLAFASTAAAAEPTASWNGTLTIAACDAATRSLPLDTEAAMDATLLVRGEHGLGSAVLISPDGFALTAAHVVRDATHVSTTTYAGDVHKAHVIRTDAAQDIALIKIETRQVTPCSDPSVEPATIGEDVFVLGSPGGEELSFSISKGIVSGRRNFDGHRFIQLDASINPGNSGGPVLDADGTVVGIVSWKIADVAVEGLAFAVPTPVALSSLQLELGTRTDADWPNRKGHRVVAPSITGAEVPKSHATSVAPETRRRLALRRGLIAAGAGALATGVIMVVVPAAIRATADGEIPADRWASMVAVNTTGWVLAGAGAAMLVGGLLVRRSPRTKRSGAADVAFAPTGTGMSVGGRF